MIFFTSDQHFGHKNIIKYCNRPFDSVEEMDHAMIKNWNASVRPNDTVYHLGDFTLGDNAHEYFIQLNGEIKILTYPSHHDKRWLNANRGLASLQHPVQYAEGLVVIDYRPSELHSKGYPISISLCHFEMANWDRKHHGAWHLFGHDHRKNNVFNGAFSMNIGVDANDFTPVSLRQAKDYMVSNDPKLFDRFK